jgi:uncharacterized protein (DUF1778 family)
MATAATARLEARVSPEEKELLEEAANVKGLTITELLVSSAHDAAVRILREHTIIELGRNDQLKFVKAMLRPEEPNERLRALAKRPGIRSRR